MQNIQSNDQQQKASTVDKPASKKSVFLAMVMFVVVILVLGTVSAVAYYRLFANDSGTPVGVIFEEVKRGVFVHEVTDRGNVESAQNEEIRCNVESMSGVMIVWIIPEGTVVEEGEVLVRLDSSNLDERFANQEITVANTEAAVKQATADKEVAKLALMEYEQGTFPKEETVIQNRILKAEEDLSRATANREYTEKLLAQGYVTELQLKADTAREEQLQNDLKSAKLELKVLKELTKQKMLEQYSANIITAEAQLASANRRNSIETTRLNYLETQIGYFTIKAPKAGQVVYATPNNPWRRDMDVIKEGMTARERQTLIRLPDPQQMQVAGMVNEASVSLVKVGQPATITLQAMPNQIFNGIVKQVNDYPEPDGPMGSMAKEYKCIITMDDLESLPPNIRSGIRPGLSAQLKIDVTDPSIEDMPILVPVQTLFENSGKYYCITCDNGKWDKVEVEVGATNDKEVVIKKGLTEGMRVVQGAWRYIDRVLTEEERTGAREFGIGGARQRRGGPGGPPSGLGSPGAPGSQDGQGRAPGADMTPPPGGGPNPPNRNTDTPPPTGESRPGNNEPREELSVGVPTPANRQPPAGGDVQPIRPPLE
ncbi:MAG: HlyD family efflux transporter periplasmic adaptor subunit [Planctomycetaceae bacterium]|nr:HlyD family efflux transporter periplasmic adaptor subunit [Planctomycetaceae bacterium]